MKYLLDTNICVHFLRGKYNLDQKLRAVGIENCYISEITLLELEYGVENSDAAFQSNQKLALEHFAKQFNDRILPIRSCFTIYSLKPYIKKICTQIRVLALASLVRGRGMWFIFRAMPEK